MMKYIHFLPTISAIFSIILCHVSFAADTGDCGTNCRYTYDPSTQTITYTGTGENGAGIISKSNRYYDLSGSIKNIIVEEGITDIVWGGTPRETFNTVGDGTGKLVLPSTLKTMGTSSSYDMKFATVEINSKNLQFGTQEAFGLTSTNTTLVVNPDIQISGSFYSWNGMHPGTLSIKCKGNPQTCSENMGEIVQYFKDKGTKVSYDYYREKDAQGNVTLEYFDDGFVKYDSDGNITEKWNLDGTEQYSTDGKLLLATYDTHGNQIGSYQYDAGGNLIKAIENDNVLYRRRIYTISEAASAVQNNKNKNTFSIIYR